MRPLQSSYYQQAYSGTQADYGQNPTYPNTEPKSNYQDQQSRDQNQDQSRRPVHLQRRMYPGVRLLKLKK